MAVKLLSSLVVLSTIVQYASAGLVKRVACPGTTHTAINGACCNWFNVLDDIQVNLFDGGECGEEAHESIRLMFHDAIGFSESMNKAGQFGGGGADGSIILFSDVEETFSANLGTEDMADTQRAIADAHGLSYGDIIYFAGAVALTNCAGGPRLEFLANRPNATAASPPGLVPDPFNPVDQLLSRMADAGFTPQELVSLLASHSTAAQDHVDPSVHGSPMDSTPSAFDTQIFIEVQLRGVTFPGTGGNQGEVEAPLPGEVRLQSDHLLARDSRTNCFWQDLANNHDAMVKQFTAAMSKLATLGQNRAALLDCSEVIPIPKALTTVPMFPAGKTIADVEQACATAAFPNLPTVPGPEQTIPVVPSS